MLAIIVAVESFVDRHAAEFTDSPALSWTLSQRSAVQDSRGVGILIVGDSLAKHGLLPDVLGPRLGRKALNLSASGAQAATSYYLLKHALDAGARPEAVVVDFMPDLLSGEVSDAGRQWPELLSMAETVEMSRASRNFGFLTRTAVTRILRSGRSRREIGASLTSALRGGSNPLRLTNLTLARNWAIHGGAQFTGDNPGHDGSVISDIHGRPLPDRFRCSRVNNDYLDRFFGLARSRGIAVYWVLPPVSPALQARRERGGGDAAYSAFVRARVDRHPGVVVLDARRSAYDHDRFVDPIHLTGKGALALSNAVADAIAGGRTPWVDLPPCEVSPLPRPLEDLESSRLAVLAEWSARR